MKLVIIGAGSFGTALAQELSQNENNRVQLLFRNEETMLRFNQTHLNKRYFPNRKLDSAIEGVRDWESVESAEVVFLAVPTKGMTSVIKAIKPHLKPHTVLVNLTKGIYKKGQTLVEFLIEELSHKNTVTLKGPSFSTDLINSQATLLTLGFSNREQLKVMKAVTKDTNIFLDYTSDIRGVELLSALKNIYAIILGNVDARYNAVNTRFLILTKIVSEIKIILKCLGGKEETLFLGCGLGDLNLTTLNDLSRNRTLGLLIGKGFYSQSFQENSVVLEGVNTLQFIQKIIPSHLQEQLPMLYRAIAFFVDGKETALNLNFKDLFKKRFKTVLTYGTYDLLHFGHLEILRRAKELGDQLIVGLSTDEFNEEKGKKCEFSYAKRKKFLESLSYVDWVIPERNWEQKVQDVVEHEVDTFVMGSDWEGKFDFLKEYCTVHYFERTKGVSTTQLKALLKKEKKEIR